MKRADIRRFAREQFLKLCETGEGDELVSFEYNGTSIVDPWMDPTGRFELSEEEARGMYGQEQIEEFARKAEAKQKANERRRKPSGRRKK